MEERGRFIFRTTSLLPTSVYGTGVNNCHMTAATTEQWLSGGRNSSRSLFKMSPSSRSFLWLLRMSQGPLLSSYLPFPSGVLPIQVLIAVVLPALLEGCAQDVQKWNKHSPESLHKDEIPASQRWLRKSYTRKDFVAAAAETDWSEGGTGEPDPSGAKRTWVSVWSPKQG